jgi:hypothetical protein
MNNLNQINSEIEIISVVVPSVNGNKSNLIVLTGKQYKKLRDAADDKTTFKKEYFALFCDATVYHDILNTRYGAISKEQFDNVIKDEYNSALQLSFRKKPMKMIK